MKETIETYLMNLGEELQLNGYTTQLKYQDYLGGEKPMLTAKKGAEILQLQLNTSRSSSLGGKKCDYTFSILANSKTVLTDIESINFDCRKKAKFHQLARKKFHDNLNTAINALYDNYANFEERAGGRPVLEERVASFRKEDRYSESLELADFVHPVIGLEYDENGLHPVFGIAVGGDDFGGLFMYDPSDNQIEVGEYFGFGHFGLGMTEEAGTPGEVFLGSAGDDFDGSSNFGNFDADLDDIDSDFSSGCSMPDFGGCDTPDCDMPDCDVGDCDIDVD